MRIDLRSRGTRSGARLKALVAARLGAALAHAADWLQRVVVRLSGGQGRGGVDKRCQVQLVFRHRPTLVVVAVGTDFRSAVDAAARRAGRASRRLLWERH